MAKKPPVELMAEKNNGRKAKENIKFS